MSTVAELFVDARARWGDRPALRTRTATGWIARTWGDWFETSRTVALALGDLGVGRGGRVALLSRARRDAAEAALGVALGGAALVTLPTRADDEDVERLLYESGATVLLVDDPTSLARLFARGGSGRALREGARALRRVVMFDARPPRSTLRFEDVVPVAERSRVMHWPELMSAGRRLAERSSELDVATTCAPGDLFARVHTAGRGGVRRAVEITHARVAASVEALSHHVPLGPEDEQLAVAPLSSVFGLSQLVAAIRFGASTSFADPEATPESQIAEVNPTVLAAPPSFYERLRDEALAHLQRSGRVRRALVDEALAVGLREAARARDAQEPGVIRKAEHRAARAVVLDALKERLAGSRLRLAVSVGGALARGVAEWFQACGVLVLEGYGMAEAAGLTHLNTPDARRLGTVGRALPGVEARIDDDGEIVLRGPMIDGELYTGDRGSIDDEGFLTVRERAPKA